MGVRENFLHTLQTVLRLNSAHSARGGAHDQRLGGHNVLAVAYTAQQLAVVIPVAAKKQLSLVTKSSVVRIRSRSCPAASASHARRHRWVPGGLDNAPGGLQ